MEDLHGDLVLAVIFLLEFEVLDGDVLFDIFARESHLFVHARADPGHDEPVRNRERDAEKGYEEPVSVSASV